MVTIPNPKSLIFIAAFLPQFVDPERALFPQYAVLAPTFIGITFAGTSCWALLSGILAPRLRDGKRFSVIVRISSVLIAVSAIGMLLAPAG